MNFQIYITRTAEQDLNEAADYIEFVLKNPAAADNLLNLASEKINALSGNPKIYPIVEDPVLHSWGIRFVAVNNFLAFYTINENTNMIYIIRFLYVKRDWNNILRQWTSHCLEKM